MSVNKKKRLVVPLNAPGPPIGKGRVLAAVLRPPLLVLVFIFGNIYKLCFGWLDKRIARKNEERFADEIRAHLSFLFTEYGAHRTPNEGVPFPLPFDGACVTVAVGTLYLRFFRGTR